MQKDDTYEGPSATARIQALGLENGWLIRAVHAGEIDRRNTSSLEPATASGIKAWCAAIRTLREETIELGEWDSEESNGLPRIVNKVTRVTVTACAGDENVGLVGREPKAKNPRGSSSVHIVRTNQRQLNLFTQLRYQRNPETVEQLTWWLLYYSNGEGLLRAELSLPVAIGEDSRFSDWSERIILDIPSLDDRGRSQEEDEDLIQVEVSVRPKS